MADALPQTKADAPTNPRGIPYAPFVHRVEDYVATRADVEPTLQRFQEMISKYQFMQANHQRRIAGLRHKLPDMEKTLDAVRFLQMRKQQSPPPPPLHATFELNDTLHASAHVHAPDDVYLWLGANVMLAYPLAEAEALLVGKLRAAQTSLAHCEDDMDFLREQITTMEVATARVYNWDVGMRRREKAEGKGGEEEGEGGPSSS